MASVTKSPRKSKSEARQAEPIPLLLSRAERLAAGKALRDSVPRASHAEWKPPIERANAVQLKRYAAICGGILARAHAKSGDASTISGYLGKSDRFDRALGAFSLAYADQNEKDHASLVEAVRTGRVEVLIGEA
jgi:hypothetical protein